jgi:hypothetical protein
MFLVLCASSALSPEDVRSHLTRHDASWTEERLAHLVAALDRDGDGEVEETGWATLVQLLDRDEPGRPGTCTAETTSTPPPTSPASPACVDDVQNCATWAASGECSSNPGFMLRNCKRSCSQCERGLSTVRAQQEVIPTFFRATPWVSAKKRNSAFFIRAEPELGHDDVSNKNVYDLCRANCEQSGLRCWAFEVSLDASRRDCTLWSKSDSFTSFSV